MIQFAFHVMADDTNNWAAAWSSTEPAMKSRRVGSATHWPLSAGRAATPTCQSHSCCQGNLHHSNMTKKILILGFYVPKPRYDSEACRSGGLRYNSDHLEFFNMRPMHGTQDHSDMTTTWLHPPALAVCDMYPPNVTQKPRWFICPLRCTLLWEDLNTISSYPSVHKMRV